MSIKKMRDWSGWWDGLRTSMMKAGATSVATNLAVFGSTNTVAACGIPHLQNVGENWKTFLIGIVAQFGLHTAYAAAVYVQNNPDAPVVTVESNTEFASRNPTTGLEVKGTRQTITTTPVVEKAPDNEKSPS